MFAIITVLELPPRESCNKYVNLESLYGTWDLFPSTKADITFPNAESERFIFVASNSLCPFSNN